MIKRYFWIILLAASLPLAWGFALLAPLGGAPGGEPWQTANLGYDLPYLIYLINGAPESLGDIGGPHDLAQGYRRNAPILYYSYDASFDQGDYFGLQGQQAIDDAFTIMNGITNVDHYSPTLTEFPFTGQHYNYTAEAMYLTDLKSVTLHLLVEQLGLADPARYAWCLRGRFPGIKCPLTTTYTVVQRNFDSTLAPSLTNRPYSAFVNNAQISYFISDDCSAATTVTFLTDPEGVAYTPVAANTFQTTNEFAAAGLTPPIPTPYGLQIGGYYAGLTRDDVQGLRYLLSTNNAQVEPIPATSQLFTIATNLAQQALFPAGAATNTVGTNGVGGYSFDGNFGYGDYGALVTAAATNSPAALLALYPGLVIASSSNYFVIATNWTYSVYFTNQAYGQPYPPALTLVTVSNPVPYLLQKYVTTFANVFPDPFHPWRSTTTFKLQTTTVTPPIGAPYGSPYLTNNTLTTKTLNQPSGDFFLLPLYLTNACPVDILYVGLTNVLVVTNSLSSAVTNLATVASTNLTTGTNTGTYSATLSQIFYYTNYTFVIHPTTCGLVSKPVQKFRGIGGVKFVRNDTYDYLLGQYIVPITNYYTMWAHDHTNTNPNSAWQLEHLVRIVTVPDILLAAADMGGEGTVTRTINFNATEIVPGLEGPGTIDSPTLITYDRSGLVYMTGPFSDTNSFLNPYGVGEATQFPLFQWASFDGSSNVPVLYPNTTSLQNLENQMTVELFVNGSPAGPLSADNGLNYSVQFSAGGGAFTPQFTWAASGVSGEAGSGIPPGLTLTSTGLLSGTPAVSGTYDFVLQLTDILGHTVQWTLSITIN